MSEKKIYTFIECNKCVGTNGSQFNDVSAKLLLTNFEQKEVNGSKLITARARISNQEKVLSRVLDKEIVADEKGHVWVTVSFWEDKAERITKYLGDRDSAFVFIVGSISCKEYDKKDGSGKGVSVTINAKNWTSAGIREEKND